MPDSERVELNSMNEDGKRNRLILAVICILIISAASLAYFIHKGRADTGELAGKESMKHIAGYNSASVYVYNLTDKKVVKNINGRKKFPMASLTKLMTCRKALQIMEEKKLSLKERAGVTHQAYSLTETQEEIMVGYKVNEKTSFADLLYAMIMQSDGACANSIANILSGTVTRFVESMNREAKSLGLKNTHYETVEGVDKEGQYSTGEDVSKLLAKSLENKIYYKIFTDKDFTSSVTTEHPDGISFSNAVISKFEEYGNKDFKLLGGKFGFTPEAGKSLAVLVEKNKKKYIVTTLGYNTSPEDYGHVEDVIKVMKSVGN